MREKERNKPAISPPPPPFPTHTHAHTVQEKLQDLTQLALEVIKIDMYRAETCSVLGQFQLT